MRDSGVSAILVGRENELPLVLFFLLFINYHERMKELGWLYARES